MVDSFFGSIGQSIASFGSGIASFVTGSTNPNSMISSYRSQGIPYGAEGSYGYADDNPDVQFSESAVDKDWRVRISHDLIYQNAVFDPLVGTGGLVFPYLPTIDVNYTANYDALNLTHSNYPMYAYKNSQIDEISVSGTFTVSSRDEALYWLAMNHFFRTVTKMYFGQGPNLGSPPPICTFNAYGDFVFNNVSVVVKSYHLTLEKEVDYISVGNYGSEDTGAEISYVPTMSTINVVLLPVYSREKMKSFNLSDFASGKLITAPDGKGFI